MVIYYAVNRRKLRAIKLENKQDADLLVAKFGYVLVSAQEFDFLEIEFKGAKHKASKDKSAVNRIKTAQKNSVLSQLGITKQPRKSRVR